MQDIQQINSGVNSNFESCTSSSFAMGLGWEIFGKATDPPFFGNRSPSGCGLRRQTCWDRADCGMGPVCGDCVGLGRGDYFRAGHSDLEGPQNTRV